MAIRKHLSALVICLLTVFALGGLMPATALAAAPSGQVIYVGDEDVTSGGYWTTDAYGKLTSGSESSWNVHYDASANTLTLKDAMIVGGTGSTIYSSVGIYASNYFGGASLTISLQGENMIINSGYGIFVEVPETGDASLTIAGDGSLNASGTQHGIQVQSNGGDATLTIQNADVTAQGGIYGNGVTVQAGRADNQNYTATLTMNGGKLIASGAAGIQFDAGRENNTITTKLSVGSNALVDTRGGGIKVSGNNSETGGLTPSGTGIVWDGKDGTVYGSVTLQENLEIGEGESLKLDDGASLSADGYNVIVDGGTVDDGIKNSLGDSVKYAPSITTASLSNGTVGTSYKQTIAATGFGTITWSVTSGSLPAGLSLNESTGEIAGTPTAGGSSTFSVKAENSYGSDSKELSITINESATVPVAGVSLDQSTLTLTEEETAAFTATVEPANATNKDVTWSSNDEAVATVDADGKVTAVGVGTTTITVTTEDGSFIDTCKVTVKHGNMILTPQKDATCTEEGNTEYWTCKTCGKIFGDAAGKTEITLAETVIPATNHNYIDGKCTVCGDTDPNYQEPTSPTKDKPATEDKTENTKDSTATKSNTPQTSDALFGYAVFFVAIIILASIVSVVAYRKLHTVQAKHSSSNKH